MSESRGQPPKGHGDETGGASVAGLEARAESARRRETEFHDPGSKPAALHRGLGDLPARHASRRAAGCIGATA